ncbi:DUF262 domain-containing protein [Helicobacter sp. 11S02596-1]|uniref:DUF262 domain-containing protein n=1 Tax=Helicobacter sp. 11S02596-1 TaxID=1476194 RepID=UPI000BD8E70A|nr:DUF262 domain-containing protein [Helicobacter sp. 11S02596-1]PAF43189.1 hypothetical protein BJI48_05445 [Helicobacter sp. 11S02596-1]
MGGGAVKSLIDGQQRLTTFSILIKALYDNLSEEDKKEPRYAGLFYDSLSKKTPKITHSHLDKPAFESIIQADDISNIPKAKDESQLVKCYRYFSTQVQNLDKKKEFLDYILTQKLWVIIQLDSNENEQKIFDSINTAGLRLSVLDIIKNSLFYQIRNLEPREDIVRGWYEPYWKDVFEKDADTIKNWDRVHFDRKRGRSQSDVFIYAFAVIEGIFELSKGHRIENLSQLYKEKFASLESLPDSRNFLQRMKKYAELYAQFPVIEKNESFIYEDDIKRFFHILSFISATPIPLVLALKAKLENDEKNFLQCLKILENFLMFCWFNRINTDSYSAFFLGLTCDVIAHQNNQNLSEVLKRKFKEKLQEYDNLGNMDDALEEQIKWKPKDAKLVLFWIELYRQEELKGKKDRESDGLVFDMLQLEHILPQKWQTNWNCDDKSDEEMEYLVHMLGNMTLLQWKNNVSLSNSSWEKKKEQLEKTSDFIINKEIIKNEKWDENAIKARTQNFIKEIYKIWDFNSFLQ